MRRGVGSWRFCGCFSKARPRCPSPALLSTRTRPSSQGDECHRSVGKAGSICTRPPCSTPCLEDWAWGGSEGDGTLQRMRPSGHISSAASRIKSQENKNTTCGVSSRNASRCKTSERATTTTRSDDNNDDDREGNDVCCQRQTLRTSFVSQPLFICVAGDAFMTLKDLLTAL